MRRCEHILLAGVLAGVSFSFSPAAETPSILLITIDTLRADHLGCYGYFRDTSPAIDKLAGESLLFEDAVTTMATTLPAHVSLLTSTYPARHGVLSNMHFFQQPSEDSADLQTITQFLQRAGYATAGFVSTGHLGPGSGIDAGFTTFPDVDVEKKEATDMTDLAIGWLESNRSRPFFLWVHYFDPHRPYEAPPPYRDRYATDADLEKLMAARQVPASKRDLAATMHNDYDGEVRYTDAEVGRLLRQLEEWGIHREIVTILTSDHGEGLFQHSILAHGEIFNEQLYIPLLVRFPRQAAIKPGRVEGLVSLIDVFPMVAAALGLPLPMDRLDGVNVLAEPRPRALAERSKRFGRENFALLDSRWKYMYHERKPDGLYDLQADFVEVKNVIAEFPEIGEAMRRTILETVESERRREPRLAIKDSIPPEQVEALKSLGYVD